MGRVSSVDWFISIALVPPSYAQAAPVATALGALGAAVNLSLLGMRAPRGATAPA